MALETVDAGPVGSAMLTGIAIGCFKDLDDAAKYMVQKKKTYVPNLEMHEKYMSVYQRYKKLYSLIESSKDVPILYHAIVRWGTDAMKENVMKAMKVFSMK